MPSFRTWCRRPRMRGMERTNFPHPDGTWEALRLAVAESARPTLRVLGTRGGRFVMVDESRERHAGGADRMAGEDWEGRDPREAGEVGGLRRPGAVTDAPPVLFARVE